MGEPEATQCSQPLLPAGVVAALLTQTLVVLGGLVVVVLIATTLAAQATLVVILLWRATLAVRANRAGIFPAAAVVALVLLALMEVELQTAA